jgi:Tfp pilus assembly protein PilW
MGKVLRNKRGFTIAELLIAALFGMIVMATLYGFFRDQLFNLLSQETKTATMEDARGALDLMIRELRNAGSWTKSPYTAPSGCTRVASASSTSIRIQADLNANGSCDGSSTGYTGDDVMYTLSSSSITRSLNGGSTKTTVIDNVVPAGSNDFLTYYPSGTAPAPFCFSTGSPSGCSGDLAANLANIKRIKIAFAVQVQNPNPNSRAANPNITSTISSSVEFRN